MLGSAIVNFSMGAPSDPVKPSDFPFDLLKIPEKRTRINRAAIADKVRSAFGFKK